MAMMESRRRSAKEGNYNDALKYHLVKCVVTEKLERIQMFEEMNRLNTNADDLFAAIKLPMTRCVLLNENRIFHFIIIG